MTVTGHFIDGAMRSESDATLDRFDPSTGEVIGGVAVADGLVVDEAVVSSREAFRR